MFFILLFLKMHTKVFREKVKWFSGICFKISNQKKIFFLSAWERNNMAKYWLLKLGIYILKISGKVENNFKSNEFTTNGIFM